MTKIGPLVIKNALLCEDVRQEKNNKLILIGVFTGGILVPELPVSILLAFFLDMEWEKAGEHDLFLKMSGPGRDSSVLFAKIKTKTDKATAALPGPRVEVNLARAGTLKIAASLDQKTWRTIISKTVAINPESASSG